MATVTNTIKLPDGTVPSSVAVEIELVSSSGVRVAGWVTATDVGIVGVIRPTVTAGVWSVSLAANDDITPASTLYKVNEYVNGRRYTYYIDVTGSGNARDMLAVVA